METSLKVVPYKKQYWRSNLRYVGKLLLGAAFTYFHKEEFRVNELKGKLNRENNCFVDVYLKESFKRQRGSGRSVTSYDRTELGLKRLVKYGLIETWKEGNKRFFRVTDKGHKLLADWYWKADSLVAPEESERVISVELRKVS